MFSTTSRGALHVAAFALLTAAAAAQAGVKLRADDATQLDYLGHSAAADGDRIVLGAPYEDHAGLQDAGAAYVFERAGTGWAQTAKLIAADGQAFANFGAAVALDGDQLLVGADRMDSTAAQAGVAYVFVHDGSSWSQQARLDPFDPADLQTFGNSVALDGDTALIGARQDGANAEGAAYVFVRSGTTWTQQAKLLEPTPGVHSVFGTAVALQDDTAVVTSRGTDSGTPGAVHVWQRSGSTWTHQARLDTAGDPDSYYVGISVDLDGDRVLAGDYGDGPPGEWGHGAAHVFVRSGSTWTHEAKLAALDSEPSGNFGYAVALEGPRAAVGASGATVHYFDAGAGYVFVQNGTTWSQQAQFLASDPAGGDYLGLSAALAGTAAVFGSRSDEGGPDAGAAYVFETAPATTFTYCAGKTNGLGCAPFLSAYGAASATSTEPFRITAHDLTPNQACVLLYSFAPANLSFHGGKLCVKAPFHRVLPPKTAKFTGPQPCPGVVTRNFNARIQAGVDPGLSVGAGVRAQWYQRDPFDPAGFGDGLTNGVRFVIEP